MIWSVIKNTKAQIIIIIVLVILAYSNIFNNNFAGDDIDFITGWEAIRSFENIDKILTFESTPPTHPNVYRPLRTLFLMFLYKFFGQNPFYYHFVSILVHLANTVLVYFITRKLISRKHIIHNTYYLIPFLTALLFGLHPVHVDSVTAILTSIDLISVVFFFSSFYLYITGKRTYLIFAVLAVFSSEMTLTLPLIFIAYDFIATNHKTMRPSSWMKIFRAHSARTSGFNYLKLEETAGVSPWVFIFKKTKIFSKGLLIKYNPIFLIWIIFLFIRFILIKATFRGAYLGDSFYLTMLVMTQVFIKYLKLVFFPIYLSLNHEIDEGIYALSDKQLINNEVLKNYSIFTPKVFLSILALILIIILAFRLKNGFIKFSIFWFFITLLPVSFLLPQGEIMAERYLYIASFGFCLFIVVFFNLVYVKAKDSLKRILIIIFIFLIFGYGYRIYSRNKDWADNFTIWYVLTLQNPRDPKSLFNVADLYDQQGMYQKSLEYFFKALEYKRDFYQSYGRIGLIYQKQQDIPQAYAFYQKALNIEPNYQFAREQFSRIRKTYQSTILGLVFAYPEGWDIFENTEAIMIQDKKANLFIEMKVFTNIVNFQKTLDQESAHNGLQPIKAGQAYVIGFNKSYIKIFKKDNFEEAVLYLLKDQNLLVVKIFPFYKLDNASLETLLGSIKFDK